MTYYLIKEDALLLVIQRLAGPMKYRFVTRLGITSWVKSVTGIYLGLNIDCGDILLADYQLFYVFGCFFFVAGRYKVKKILHLCHPKSG